MLDVSTYGSNIQVDHVCTHYDIPFWEKATMAAVFSTWQMLQCDYYHEVINV